MSRPPRTSSGPGAGRGSAPVASRGFEDGGLSEAEQLRGSGRSRFTIPPRPARPGSPTKTAELPPDSLPEDVELTTLAALDGRVGATRRRLLRCGRSGSTVPPRSARWTERRFLPCFWVSEPLFVAPLEVPESLFRASVLQLFRVRQGTGSRVLPAPEEGLRWGD